MPFPRFGKLSALENTNATFFRVGGSSILCTFGLTAKTLPMKDDDILDSFSFILLIFFGRQIVTLMFDES